MSEHGGSNREPFELQLDYLKHLTTLSTGSILIIVTFLEKLFKQPQWKFLVPVSLSCFLFTVLTSLLAMSLTMALAEESIDNNSPWENVRIGSTYVSLCSFFIGLLALVVFSVKNTL
jgi:hypothetical protein